MIKRQNFHLFLNRDVKLEVYLAANTPDLTGAIVSWYLGVNDEATGADIKLTKRNTTGGLTVEGTFGNYMLSIPITKANTSTLPEQEYHHLVDIKYPDGKEYPAMKGVVTSEKLMTGPP